MMFDFRSRKEKEEALLWCLEQYNGFPAYGLHLASVTGIGRGTIYVYLASLEDRGLVRSCWENLRVPPGALKRRVYFAAPTNP